MTQKEIENLKSKGMAFNSPDPKPFQDAPRKTDFYKEMKGKSGDEPWAPLEISRHPGMISDNPGLAQPLRLRRRSPPRT